MGDAALKKGMGSERDSASERVVLNRVPQNQIVVSRSGVIGQQDPAGIILYEIVGDHRVIDAS